MQKNKTKPCPTSKSSAFTLMNIWAFLMRQTVIWRWNKSSSKLETLLASLLCKQYCADSSLQHSVTQSFGQAVVVFHLPFHLPVSCRHPHCSNSAHSFVVEEAAAPVGHCVCECGSSSELEGNSRWCIWRRIYTRRVHYISFSLVHFSDQKCSKTVCCCESSFFIFWMLFPVGVNYYSCLLY